MDGLILGIVSIRRAAGRYTGAALAGMVVSAIGFAMNFFEGIYFVS